MIYCGKAGGKEVSCYPSKCSKRCKYRVAALASYESDRAMVFASGIDYCRTRCSSRCTSPVGQPCNNAIEGLIHNGYTIEDILEVDLSDM